MKALVIPVEGPLYWMDLGGDNDLPTLQAAVGGFIEAVRLPEFVDPAGCATGYINEEGKLVDEPEVNWRATDFMVPGVGLRWGDFIAGPMVLVGFDPSTGLHERLPEKVEARARLIEREAGTVAEDDPRLGDRQDGLR
jgi:hypothetical protein